MNTPQNDQQRVQLEQRIAGLFHLLQRFENLQQQKEAVYQRHAHLYTPYKPKWRAGMYWLWVLLGTIALTIIVAMIFFGAMSAWSSTYQSDSSAQPPVSVAALFLTPLPVALILAGVLVAVRNGRVPAKNAQIEAANQATAQQIAQLAAPEVGPIDAQLAAARKEYRENYNGWWPEKYLNTVDVGACWHIVHDRHVSTIQEAVKELIEDQHKQAVLDMHAAQIAEQQRATRVAQVNGVINASMQGAMIGTMIDQGNKTRAAMNAPVTVRLKK
ncbi:hypothetical protein [uncultured Microbacterium sp.]|uniref:hypothetical protein n=1 Tax=uncultured Microbacterium sp. TaxID=191216 RepID=UPI0026395005|nr:hypothetical protein [uncultured Microbacterium sp.]